MCVVCFLIALVIFFILSFSLSLERFFRHGLEGIVDVATVLFVYIVYIVFYNSLVDMMID